MVTKITLDMLTEVSVSVSAKDIEDGGIEYAVGEPHRAYINSERGRARSRRLAGTVPVSRMAVWGDRQRWSRNPLR